MPGVDHRKFVPLEVEEIGEPRDELVPELAGEAEHVVRRFRRGDVDVGTLVPPQTTERAKRDLREASRCWLTLLDHLSSLRLIRSAAST